MTARGFALFDTALGRCGIAWGEHGIVGVQLPEANDAETRRRLLRRARGAEESQPPAEVEHAIDGIAALLAGEKRDLSAIRLDMDGLPPFNKLVYAAARTVPPGAILSYGEIANRLGDPGAARAVGQALGHNPFPIVVPCHRVLAAGGRIGGFSASGGAGTKRRLLAVEAVHAGGPPRLFD